MKRRALIVQLLFAFFVIAGTSAQAPQPGFKTVVYVPVDAVLRMKDPLWLQQSWAQISSQLHVDKVYIETYRSRVLADDATIEAVKQFFTQHGVAVAGGICYSDKDNGQFASFTYTKPADRDYVKQVSTFTARHFDEVILDDFFFANTKSPSDIAAKGSQSWTDFRLKEMDEVSRDLIVGPAHAANPRVKVIIKFPNWYEHFRANGYDLAQEPAIYDGIYAGTETRDPVETDQNLQQYESFNIVRYFTNIDPGHMGGGWVDSYDIRYIDRYSEQLWLTTFARAQEVTLFNYLNMLEPAKPGVRPWSGQATSVNWERINKRAGGHPTFATVAGDALDQVRPVVAGLGVPIGVASYRPLHAVGEDFLHNYLGMIGIPIDLRPEFPTEAPLVLLTEAAQSDPDLVKKIKTQLTGGKDVVITSGLLRGLEGKGIEDIVELRYSALPEPISDFIGAYGPGAGTSLGHMQKAVLFPQIHFATNDAWPLIRGVADGNAFPLLLSDKYAAGTLYVLTVPDNFTDLYELPEPTLNALRSYILSAFPLRLDAPSKVSLLAYNNDTFLVESFRDQPTDVTVLADASYTKLRNLVTGEALSAVLRPRSQTAYTSFEAPLKQSASAFTITLPAHSFLAFSMQH